MGIVNYTVTMKNYNEDVQTIANETSFIIAIVKFVVSAYKAYKNKDVSFEFINFQRNVIG